MADALSILYMGTPDAIPKEPKKKERRKMPDPPKRPEGINRELYALLCGDSKDPAPIMTSDVMAGGYKQVKAKLGLKKARQWKWMEFVNPARKDNCRLFHWRRVLDAGKEYPFAKFNKSVVVASYTDQEYIQYLQVDNWTRAETDHLIDLCKRFDLRFIIIHDRWDREMFPVSRSVEDLKERYYSICNILAKAKATSTTVSTLTGVKNTEHPKLRPYDADHERRRKEQLIKLYNRTPEQIEEELNLQDELRKIEQKRKEREKKTQDLQKLITAADANSTKRKVETPGPVARPPRRKKVSSSQQRTSGSKEATASSAATNVNVLEAGIKFPEFKTAGASLRSHRMKLPGSVGQKKSKAIESLLQELAIDLRPVPTEEICQHFNELRSDMVLLYELKLALSNCEYELQTLKHQYETLQGANKAANATTDHSAAPKNSLTAATAPTNVTAPNSITKIVDLFDSSEKKTEDAPAATPAAPSSDGEDKRPSISDALNEVTTPNRKRRAALEQSAFMKKIKKL